VLLEAQEPGFGASGRNGGQVNPGLKPDPDAVERRFGADLGGRMVAFAGAAPGFVFDLIERLRIDCAARRCGTLRAAVHPRHLTAVRITAEQHARRGAPVDMLDAAGIAEATGTDRYCGAMLDRRGGSLNPLSFARGLARAALAAGAAVHGQSRVLGLDRQGGAWRARTACGSVTAPRVLIATNGYTDDLWPGLRRSIVPVWSSIAATAPLPDSVRHRIMPGGHVLYESGTVTVYYRVDGDRLLIGGRGPMREIGRANEIGYILDYAQRLWPSLDGVSWTHAWGGQLGMTRDHYPHIHEPAAGITVCLGYNGRGVALATALGAELAAKLTSDTARLDMPVSPVTPIPLHGLWRVAVAAMVARGRIADRFGY